MRFVLILLIFATPVSAWEFRPLPVCTVTHQTTEIELEMTYGHGSALYSLHLTRRDPWPGAPVFSIRFDGPRELTITTDRQVLSQGGKKLTAVDSGFGNVLNGLQYNALATASLGDISHRIPLYGAAPSIEAFRECTRALAS